MSALALHRVNAKPTEDEARAAMVGNLCRCGNYNRYVEATVGHGLSASPVTTAAAALSVLDSVGHATPKIDGPERVTGRAT